MLKTLEQSWPRSALRAYAERYRVEPSSFRADGGLVLNFDNAYRVEVRVMGDSALGFFCSLVEFPDLPSLDAQRETLMELGRSALAMLRTFSCSLTLAPLGGALLLVQRVERRDDVDEVGQIEREMNNFLIALRQWRRACRPMVVALNNRK